MGANLPVRRLVAKRVKELRLQRGWSQAELAHRAGTTDKHISGLERGKVNVSIELLASIAAGLAIDLGELLPHRSEANNTHVCLITPEELDLVEQALRIVARAKRRRAGRGRDTKA
jgi:transcriptional regulator with XRE-family HTH domain